jgi:membrane protein implicated in regulation of membrane protease activity
MTSTPPRRRTGPTTFLPIVVAICAILVVRGLIEAVLPDLSTWIAFIVALVVGWVAYTLTERFLDRRQGEP